MILGAQLYTLRNFCKTTEDFAETLKKVAEIGYTTVQISGTCPYEGDWLKAELDKNGLKGIITHSSPQEMKENPLAMVEKHRAFDCTRIGIGSCPGGISDQIYDKFVEEFTVVADTFAANGAKFYYHNHWQEFVRAADGKRFIEKLCEDFPEDRLNFILDTYWVQYAGGDPVEWIEKLKGRVDCVHFKDMDCFNKVHRMKAIGSGNMNWDGIIAACEKAGTEYVFIEQDDCNGEDPFECLKQSFEFLKSKGLK